MLACSSPVLPTLQVRFLFPVLPLFNAAAAAAAARAWQNRGKSTRWKLAGSFMAAVLAASWLASGVMLYISAHNYPGAQQSCGLAPLF